MSGHVKDSQVKTSGTLHELLARCGRSQVELASIGGFRELS